ncbi:GIY-YIG nuclease family protein [Methermicoccus shengliensis]|uniref:GIY-YIG nuclease family protein n=1 Tax=Methermicoccus shengliensis TaxID=660064 RepID=A0A832RX72_9EURY|nr:GIY-YIG nuclease family protein [Methermicoccus shengliensis]KUK05175.1 MAG: Uncharacterized protein XD46_0168 [Euryarchaeota archaeon 55_53]KUK29628.1 MAG: Uncharacterized protein XD62_1287 [Methanosarcinales archeaon 56_1174]MDI3487335.1 hypothetical protein [Methanosarcinales archaeon]MDN5294591.1 hypothetical protein [Methanosarcinales archaeon]HIH69299.1 GIY-YIG nuclease family protein [Methermicoccus shengliensis]
MYWGRKGVYTLIVYLPTRSSIEVGSLGELVLEEGYYTYTGSAWGAGGMKRVLRHLSVAGRNVRRWHIDYLLPHVHIAGCVMSYLSKSAECLIARALSEKMGEVRGFGCSDCSCTSHLHYLQQPPLVHVLAAHIRAERSHAAL